MAYFRAIKDMYGGTKLWFTMVWWDAKHFPMKIGLHKGSTLSLFLFALVMDELMWCIQDEVILRVLFVDDIVLIDKKYSGVNATLGLWYKL